LEDGGGAFKANMQINLATAVTIAGTPVDDTKMSNIEDGIDAIDTYLHTLTNNYSLTELLTGWIPGNATWTYASATTFTVSGDKTDVFVPGTRIKLTQTTAKYFVVLSSTYGAPNTTVTITAGTSYTLANAAITSPFFSRLSAPPGWPRNFIYTPAFTGTGVSIGDATVTTTFMIGADGWVDVSIRVAYGTTTSFGTASLSISLPATVASSPALDYFSVAHLRDVGVNNYDRGAQIQAGATLVYLFNQFDSATNVSIIHATTPFAWGSGDTLQFSARYPIA
jgi:hypothetical protein